jgi:ATP-dependent exoDNAse (exonuclease V) alpha subunit
MKQTEALDILKSGYNVFLTGAPGSGKTFLLNKYIEYLKKNNITVSVTASTGIAATHMGGTTLHSWSGIGIKEEFDEREIKKICTKGYLRKKIKKANVLIIDEISMIKASQFEAVNKICQYIKRSQRPFGGIQVVCSGDFFQLPPVVKPVANYLVDQQPSLSNSTKNEFIWEKNQKIFTSESNVWKEMNMKICYLDEQYRTKDKNLYQILNCIRENNIEKSKNLLLENLKKIPLLKKNIFTKLYTHNVDVDSINYAELSKIKGKEYFYQMTSKGNHLVVEILKKSCLAPEKLILKKDAEVMFIKNNFEAGYVNGTQGKIIGFAEGDFPIVKTHEGKKITVKYADWNVEEEDSAVAGISQIPLRLAWAITVHKSQGMNLDSAEIDLSKCFLEGMGYVALSRLKSLNGLKLVGINNLAFCVNSKALEIDKKFRKLSENAVHEMNKMSFFAIKKRQKLFIKYLES